MDEEAAWRMLPKDEHVSVWNSTERNFWEDYQQKEKAQETQERRDFLNARGDIREQLLTLEDQRKRASDTCQHFARELAAAESELSNIIHMHEEKNRHLYAIEAEFQARRQERQKQNDIVVGKMTAFFKNKRDQALSKHNSPAAKHESPAPSVTERLSDEEARRRSHNTQSVKMDERGTANYSSSQIDTGARRPEYESSPRWRTSQTDSDQQAQAQSIAARDALQHAQAQAQDATLQHQRSSSPPIKTFSAPSAPLSFLNQNKLPSLAQLGHGPRRPPPIELFRDKPSWTNGRNIVLPEPTQMPSPTEPYRAPYHQTYETAHPVTRGSFTASNGSSYMSGSSVSVNGAGVLQQQQHSRPSSRGLPTPLPLDRSEEVSPRGHASSDQSKDLNLEEITRDNLILRHNGIVYTYPECMEGVPLTKIDEKHPYWEPQWRNVKEIIEPALDSWKTKYDAAKEAEQRGESGGSSKYQIGRQVNRGVSILQFLEEGPISPYQLLSKKYMTSGKGGITSYDTLFRLSDSLDQLSKFTLDVAPIDWLRHRLHEIMQEGPEFNLSKTVHDFYRDPKLAALRRKHGMKDIGRPSGKNKDPNSRQGTAGGRMDVSLAEMDSRKRKSGHHYDLAPYDFREPTSQAQHASLPSRTVSHNHDHTSHGTQLTKRYKHHSPTSSQPISPPSSRYYFREDYHDVDGYSDTDSYCGSALNRHEFRLYQVKNRLYTSSPRVTQYWQWIPSDQSFEHQVLKAWDPPAAPQWGVHREPINFHVNLKEIHEVAYNLENLHLHLVMKRVDRSRGEDSCTVSRKDNLPRGDIMAAFKRVRTMKRFLKLLEDHGVKVIHCHPSDVIRSWNEMQSEHLPDHDDQQASSDLRE